MFKQLVQRADDGAPSLFVVSRFPLQGTTDNSVAVTASVSAFFVDEAVGHISILAHVRQRCRLRATRLHRGCYHADVEIAGDSSSPRPCIFPRHWVWSPFGAFSVTPVQHLPILSGSDSGKASGRGARRFSGPPASQAPSAASVRASKIRAPLRARFRTATCSTHHAPWVYELYVPRHRARMPFACPQPWCLRTCTRHSSRYWAHRVRGLAEQSGLFPARVLANPRGRPPSDASSDGAGAGESVHPVETGAQPASGSGAGGGAGADAKCGAGSGAGAGAGAGSGSGGDIIMATEAALRPEIRSDTVAATGLGAESPYTMGDTQLSFFIAARLPCDVSVRREMVTADSTVHRLKLQVQVCVTRSCLRTPAAAC